MDKIQYDSFYKFLVSVGVILIAAPLFGLYFFLSNVNQILLSREEFAALSEASLQFVEQRDQALLTIFKVLPYVSVAFVVVGLIFLLYGGYNWLKIQKELDKQTKLKTEEQQANVKKLTATEIAEKAINEVVAESEEGETGRTSQIFSTSRRVTKALEIENMCFSYILKTHSKRYDVQQNVRIGGYIYDIIATSKRDNIDHLFEVKYWAKEPTIGLLSQTMNSMRRRGIAYETTMHRNFRCVVLIVVPEEIIEKVKAFCEKHSNAYLDTAEIKVVTEANLA